MNNIEEFGAFEGRLCGHLAAALCVFFAGKGANGAGQKGHWIMPNVGGDWEAAERADRQDRAGHARQFLLDRK